MTRLVILAVALLALGAPTSPASACTLPPGGPVVYSLGQRAWAADVVVVGRVTAVEAPNSYSQRAVIDADDYLKGSGPGTAVVDGFGSSAACLAEVRVGMYGVFFADRLSTGELQASYLSIGDAYAPATTEGLAQLRRALGPGLALPFVVR